MTLLGNISSRKYWRRATGLALVACLCAVLLGGVSAWFLGSVAFAGLSAAALSFNFHMPAAFVRMFAVGRTAARYGERLAGHKAALTDQVSHRAYLFAGMAAGPAPRRAGWQLGGASRLADYLDDVEDIDYARLRAGLPALTLVVALVCGVLVTALTYPLALAPILALMAAAGFYMSRAMRSGQAIWKDVRADQRGGAEEFGAAMASAVPLMAEKSWRNLCLEVVERFAQADRKILALRRLQADVDLFGMLVGPVAAISVMGAAWLAGTRSQSLLLPMFIAFSWLALGEAAGGLSRMLVATIRSRAAQGETDRSLMTAKDDHAGAGEALYGQSRPLSLQHAELSRLAPDGRRIGRAVSLRLEAGRPTVLVGASGTGKTSLLKQIAGWIGDDVFESDLGALTPPGRFARATLCLHDAAILSDTIRANLFADAADDTVIWEALEAMELDGRVREGGGLDKWLSQERLSLGEAQRLNLARAWLSDRPLILLDEPTEHLDPEQASRILTRLLQHFQDRIVVLSSHRTIDWPEAILVDLSSDRRC